jgi:hypothetical protein
VSEESNSITIVGTENTFEDQVESFPNPVHDRLTVYVPGNEKTKSITLRSTDGRTLIHWPVKHDRAELNVEGLKAGVYLLHIVKDNNIYIRKILKD